MRDIKFRSIDPYDNKIKELQRYSFKTKKPPISSIKAWAEKKGLSPFALQKVIFHQGIKPSLFFTKPFEAGFKRLPEDLVEAYGLDALTIFNEQIDEILYG